MNDILLKLAKKLEEEGEKEEAETIHKMLEDKEEVETKDEEKKETEEKKDDDSKEKTIGITAVSPDGIATLPQMFDAIFDTLSEIADKLDECGAVKEANMVDDIIKKIAADVEFKDESDKTLQSHRYDSKHNNEQTFIQKTPEEKKLKDKETKHHKEEYQQTGEKSLSTRYCPIHIGVMMNRVGENQYRCELDGKTYNWEEGWVDNDGKKHPGGSVAGQTESATGVPIPSRVFDAKEDVLNRMN